MIFVKIVSNITCNLVNSQFVIASLKKRTSIFVIYTDFNKAFDLMNHTVLIKILKASGFGEPLLLCFKSYH